MGSLLGDAREEGLRVAVKLSQETCPLPRYARHSTVVPRTDLLNRLCACNTAWLRYQHNPLQAMVMGSEINGEPF